MAELSRRPARFDPDASAVIIEQVAVHDPGVTREARRWTSGEREPVVDGLDALAGAELTNYVTEALRIGAHTLSVTGQAQDSGPRRARTSGGTT